MERTIVALSQNSIPETAFSEVYSKIQSNGSAPILIVFFSDEENLWYYSREFNSKFPNATSLGAATYCNITTHGYSPAGLSAMAIYSGVEVAANCLYEIDKHPSNYINHVRLAMQSLSSCDSDSTICFALTTCLCNGEGLVQDTLIDGMGENRVPLIGSSSGKRDMNKLSAVALNGAIYSNTCVFVFIHNLNGKIITYRENLFKPTKYQFQATDVDCDRCIVYEYDDQPAAKALAGSLGVKEEELQKILQTHPMGRIINRDDDKIFLIEVKNVNPDGSISYYTHIYNHTIIALMNIEEDIDNVWLDTKVKLNLRMPDASFGLIVNCLARSKYFENNDLMNSFISNLQGSSRNFIGVSGFGEQLDGDNLNQTMVLALFE